MLTPAAGFMKVLHVGNDRELAPRLVGVLRKAGQDVAVAWVGRASDATGWVRDNPDFAAVIIEDHVPNQSCVGFIREVRGLGLTAPIVVVSTKGAAPPLAALRAGADDYVVNGWSLLPDLAGIVARGLHRAKALAARRPVRCLYLGDSALARECFGGRPHAIEIVEPGRDSTGNATPIPLDSPGPGQRPPFDVVLAEHGRPGVDIFAILKDMAARRLQVPVIFVVEWDEGLIVPALRMGASDYVLKTRDSFEALSFRLDRVRSGSILLKEVADLLRQQAELRASLMGATTALDEAQRMQASDAAITERLARREAELAVRLDEEAAARTALQQELAQSERRASEERQVAAQESSQRRVEFEARIADATAAAERLSRHEEELSAAMADTAAARDVLERRLGAAETALQAEKRAREDRQASLHAAAQRQAELESRLDREAASCAALEEKLRDAEAVIRTNVQQHAALTDVVAELTEQRAQSVNESARAAAARDRLEGQLHEAAMALERAEHARALDVAAVTERSTRHESQLMATVAETAAARDALERRLAEVEAALQQTEQRATADREASVLAASKREAEVEARLARREAELTAVIGDLTAKLAAMEHQLLASEAALQQAEQRTSDERRAAADDASRRKAEFEKRLQRDAAARRALEQKVATSEAMLRDADERHAAELARAAAQLTEHHAQSETRLAEMAAVRQTLEQQVSDVSLALETVERRLAESEAALQQRTQQAVDERLAAVQEALERRTEFDTRLAQEAARRDAAEASRLAAYRAESEAKLVEAAAARDTLEQRLNDASLALEHANQARTADRVNAAERLARREAELTAVIGDITAKLAAMEHQLLASEAALQQAEQRTSDERRAAADDASRREAEFETQRQGDAAAHRALEQKVATSEAMLRDADERHAAELARAAAQLTEHHAQSETRLAEMAAARQTLEQRLNDASLALDETKRAWTTDAAAAADRLSRREAELMGTIAKSTALRENLEALVSERDAQLKEQAVNHAASQEALQAGAANRIAHLKHELDETVAVHHRQFERLPSCMLRCSRDGAIEQVNDAMAAMLGYRAPREVQAVDFATVVLEFPDDWRSLIDRCLETGAAGSLETIWRKKDGVRFAVRLLAVTSPTGQIDVVAEDLTSYRELEEKFRRSQRMEAVGRVASEVASACDNLLRDVSQDCYAWLAAIGDDSPMRQQGELLLNDVTRAAGFLRQLDVYGKTQATQANSPASVDLNRVLRNLTSVLKRVAGDDIEFVLPKPSSPLNVDVELDRVERILVNVAAYGRERMPFGGRLMFEFANVMVGRESVAKHPEVRPGPHVLITVTAVRYAVWSDASRTLPRVSHSTKAAESASDRPGVELGAMQTLIRSCGGRLWLAAEPPGDMVLKIHLPGGTPHRAAVPRAAMPHPMRRWLHASR